MNHRSKITGVIAGIAALTLSVPTAAIAYADDEPVQKVADIHGPGCDAYKTANPTGPAAYTSMPSQVSSAALANNPDLSTFSQAMSGQLNPAVNLVSVLDNGPYNVFAPTNAAFAAMDPAQFEALKADPAALTRVLYYHIALGFLGPDTIQGKLTSQEGAQLTVTGKGGDIKVDSAKLVCGGFTAITSRIYMIDTVLDPALSQGAVARATEVPEAPVLTEVEPTETAAPEVPAEVFTEVTEVPTEATTEDVDPTTTEHGQG